MRAEFNSQRLSVVVKVIDHDLYDEVYPQVRAELADQLEAFLNGVIKGLRT